METMNLKNCFEDKSINENFLLKWILKKSYVIYFTGYK